MNYFLDPGISQPNVSSAGPSLLTDRVVMVPDHTSTECEISQAPMLSDSANNTDAIVSNPTGEFADSSRFQELFC